ncbi:MAG: AAA family ATPase [Phycisphaerae bacterium]
MRVVITGQVGLDKKAFLQRVADLAREEDFPLKMYNVGEMMYEEAPHVQPGKILDLPLNQLNSLRRSVFKDILNGAERHSNVLVNTHATFRWRHGLFYAFDYDQMKELDADIYVVLVDNIDRVHHRLVRDGHTDHTLKDLMVWREEEILATELVSQIVSGPRCFYIFAGSAEHGDEQAGALLRLIARREMKKAYLSFPMTHVMDKPDLLRDIEGFRREMKRHFVCFDPGDMEEKYLCQLAMEAASSGQRVIRTGPSDGLSGTMEVSQMLDIIADIDGQIYARDFKLIDQADMIVSLIPELEDGRPGLSSGVERELQHAHEATRDVYVIWQPKAEPSPFITETATRVFRSTDEAVTYFQESDLVPPPPHGTLFA